MLECSGLWRMSQTLFSVYDYPYMSFSETGLSRIIQVPFTSFKNKIMCLIWNNDLAASRPNLAAVLSHSGCLFRFYFDLFNAYFNSFHGLYTQCYKLTYYGCLLSTVVSKVPMWLFYTVQLNCGLTIPYVVLNVSTWLF